MSGQPEERPEAESEEHDLEEESTAADTPAEESESGPTLEELRAKADENWDRYLRAAAEMENVRKRAVRDVEHARKYALENIGRELLDVKDSLEMGIAAADSADTASLLAGSEATLKMLGGTLQRFGIAAIDPEGEPFDPELHEAMTMQPSGDVEPGTVLTVIQKGYILNGRLLRPARVIVAAEPTDG
jgi:molecular chaperone GrpE